MLKDLLRAVATGVIVFVIAVAIHQFVGVYNFNFTSHPRQEDTAVYLALGLLLGKRCKAMTQQTGSSLLADLLTAAVYCIVVYALGVVLHQIFGVYDFNVNFTRFPLEEDAAAGMALGHLIGQRWDAPRVTKLKR